MQHILICSDNYKDRKLNSILNLQQFNIHPSISPSVFIKQLPSDFHTKPYIGKKKPSLGIIGCYLAHINAITSSIDTNDHVTIYEDDICLHHSYNQHIHSILHSLDNDKPAIIMLSHSRYYKAHSFHIIKNPNYFTTAQAYIIHKNYKKLVLDYASQFYGAFDRILFNLPYNKFHVYPNLATQQSLYSIIKLHSQS